MLRTLVECHLEYAELAARRMARRQPKSIDWQDLFQEACFGLVEAAATFDSSEGVKFETWATPIMHRYMIEWLRTWQRYRNKRQNPNKTTNVPWSKFDCRTCEQPDLMAIREERMMLMAGLSRRERLTLMLYHGEGMTLKQAAMAVGVSESMAHSYLHDAEEKLAESR
jgi:RNA polymerase sigma factor (sigma-70 family)